MEILRRILVKRKRHDANLETFAYAKRLANSAMRNGALAADILEPDANGDVYCHTLWGSEFNWIKFSKSRRLRKLPRKDIWKAVR